MPFHFASTKDVVVGKDGKEKASTSYTYPRLDSGTGHLADAVDVPDVRDMHAMAALHPGFNSLGDGSKLEKLDKEY